MGALLCPSLVSLWGLSLGLSASPGLLAVPGVQVDAAKWTGTGRGSTAWEEGASTGMCSPGICAV